MNEQQAKAAEYAEILLAFSRGEKCEYCLNSGDGDWRQFLDGEPMWDFHSFNYRIAPAPVEAWVFLYASGNLGSTTWATKDGAERHHIENGCAGRAILMREVTE